MMIFNLIGNVSLIGYTANDWIVFILLAIFPSAAHIIFNLLLRYVDTTTISMSTLGEPIGASILAIFLLNEMITTIEIFGGIFIILGIFYFLRIQSGTKQLSSEVE